MVWTRGLEHADGSGNIVYAIHQNMQTMAARGNYVIDGLDVTANVSSDLTTTANDVDIASGNVFNNEAITAVGSASRDLSEAYDDLTSGQSLYVLIYIKSDGTISNPSDASGNEGVGTPATTGQQLPPDLPENAVALALVTLTFGDTTVDSVDIEDYIIEAPTGGYINGKFRVVEGSITAFDVDETTGHIGIGNVANTNAGVFIDAPAENINSNQSFDRVRFDDQGAITVLTGTTSPLVTTAFFDEPNIVLAGTGAVTDAATVYISAAPTEGNNNYSLFVNSGLSALRDVDMFSPNQVRIYDPDDSDALLFDFDTTNRTFDIGNASDSIASNLFGNINLNGNDLNNVRFVRFNDNNADTIDYRFVESGSSGDLELRVYTSDSFTRDIMIISSNGNIQIPNGDLDLNSNEVTNATNHIFTVPLYPNVRLTGGWAFNSTDDYIITSSGGTSYCYIETPDTLTSIVVAGTVAIATTWTVKLQYSDNGGTWTDLGGGWTQTDQSFPNTLTDTFTPQADRQYRLFFQASGGGSPTMSIRGIEVNY